jgi:hypothetical protein
METVLSVAAILSSLETQIAEQRAQETFHAEREAFHRGSRERHAAELERLVQHFEAFKASAASAAREQRGVPAPKRGGWQKFSNICYRRYYERCRSSSSMTQRTVFRHCHRIRRLPSEAYFHLEHTTSRG